jgi:multiple sugar transport system substrate-binding protein
MSSGPLAVAWGAVAILLAGCAAAGAAEVAQCDGEVPENTTVTVFAHEGAEAGAYQDAIAGFNETGGQDLGVTAELTLIPEGQYTDQIKSAAAADDVPDVVDFDGPTMANFAWARALKPMGECAPQELRDRLLPSIVEQGTYAGELWGIGSFDSGLGLWAWRSALEEVGARIPESYEDAWTVEEFEQILRDLQAAGYEHPLDPKFWYGSQGEWFSYAYAPILWSAGAGLVDTESDPPQAEGTLNSPEAVAAFETFQRWVQDGLIERDAVDDTNFLEKRSPLSWVGHWMYGPYKEAAGDDLVLLPLPDFGVGSRTGLGSWAWALGNTDTDADAAMAVIEYLVSDDVILAITEVNGAIPATTTAIERSELHSEGGELRLFVEQLQAAPDAAHPRPVTPAYPTITATFTSTLDDIIQGAGVQASLDEAAATIDEDITYAEGYPEPEISE